MLDRNSIYKDIFIRRFLNKFYFINTNKLPYIKQCKLEFHNIKNEKQYLTYFAFIEEILGQMPFFIKKGFHYNFTGKKVFAKDLRCISTSFDNNLNLLKFFYLNLNKKILRKKLLKKISSSNIFLTLLCSDLTIPLYRELFILINTVSFDLTFNIHNRFLVSYFFKNFKFL